MSLFDELSEKTLGDDYFNELFCKAEVHAALDFFQVERKTLDEKEYIDLMRFADLLSRSKEHEAQNKAFKIISLLVNDYENSDVFTTFSNSVLTKLGNFPAIEFVSNHCKAADSPPLELVLERYIKEAYQKVPDSEHFFTDAQYEIFEHLKNSNHFSFSGPTSLGKSFIINAFIRYLIVDENINENIIILVPTRALINQTSLQLKKEYATITGYQILSHPTVPETFRTENSRYIFVFTPERLVAYLSKPDNPKIGYLFIDEAQKVIAEKDSRSPLYYHAILQAERKSIKLYFASPNIPNPEVFLKLFEKSTEESINIKSSPVAQNRYFLDLLEPRCTLFSDIGSNQNISLDFTNRSFFDWLTHLSDGQSSIIYCNTKTDTVRYALNFSETLIEKNDARIDEVIAVIKDHLHEKYFLIDCLKKGVAFHFGNLPQRIREKIEVLFVNKVIDYVFCTSTLLEGVNLPAKNIFILSNAIGLTKFSDIDFWNLAGRAGRLAKELSGNIVCARIEDKNNRWKNPEKDLMVLKNKNIKPVKPLITYGQRNFFKNIEAALTESDFTKKSPSSNEKSIWNHYANIALIHEIRSDDSALRSNFIGQSEIAKRTLHDISLANDVPEKILSSYSMIKAKYQNRIYNDDDLLRKTLSDEISYDSVLSALEVLCDFYSWEEEESAGRNPLLKSRESLRYFAMLMSSWMNSTPLNRMISAAITHYTKNGYIWDQNQPVVFRANNQYQINLVINEIITNIDNVLRFKLKNYFGNYYDLLVEKLGEEQAGINWGEFLEYGTNDYRIIELQNLGIPRHLASYLLEKHAEYFVFEKNTLIEIQRDRLFEQMDQKSVEFKEIIEVL